MKTTFLLLILFAFLSACRTTQPDIKPVSALTQRVRATKTWYLGVYGPTPALVDTLIIQGKPYQSAAFDSTTFQYDQQDRLIRLNLLQSYSYGADYPGDKPKTIRNSRWTEYTYEFARLLMREGSEGETSPRVYPALLDVSQRRIVSRTWYDPASFTTVHDTLQMYSPEGILIHSLKILTRAGFQRQTIRQLTTVKDSNIVQTSTSYVETNQAFETTTYDYDLSHRGPLSTTTPFGERSRNALLRATTVQYESGGSIRYESTYYNEYDPNGRLVRQTMYYQPPSATQREIHTLTKFYYQ